MKVNETNENRRNASETIVARITRVTLAIFAESKQALRSQERLFRQAVNEAEALAWQTMLPHLVFPTWPRRRFKPLGCTSAIRAPANTGIRTGCLAARGFQQLKQPSN